MRYLLYGILGVVAYVIFSVIYFTYKSRDDEDVIAASDLRMTLGTFKKYKKAVEEMNVVLTELNEAERKCKGYLSEEENNVFEDRIEEIIASVESKDELLRVGRYFRDRRKYL